MIKEVILCKYGEIVLKGLNRGWFESRLMRVVRERMKPFGEFGYTVSQSTLAIEPKSGECDTDSAYGAVKKIFGFSGISRAAVVEKDIDKILECAREYLPPLISGYRTFKFEAKRSDKRFTLTSPQICSLAGEVILNALPNLRVDVHNPEITVRIEIRDCAAYILAGQERGAGGMPAGTNGKALLLLSGGIDSPVAGYMMARRGVYVEALHFESFPYTSERAREKVFSLARIVAAYSGEMKVNVISLTEIQEEIVKKCDEDYFTLLLRRFMMRLAQRCANAHHARALITGESLGQVASQTMAALCVTDAVVSIPVFRPCIGMDKDDIIALSRHIGAFETSIEPYEDCCTVFTPRHPKTKPEPEAVLLQESKLDIEGLEERAFETLKTEIFR